MKETIKFDKVADIYDLYVNADFDIPFFMNETKGYESEILELMCGTGRVSLPLLQANRYMTCIDYSEEMLNSFRKKIANKNYKVNLLNMDVTQLKLNKKFGLILLPFHSFSEILSTDKQIQALKCISEHLLKGGTFILTLQNPKTRLKLADGTKRIIGEFPIDNNTKMIISYKNQYEANDKIVTGFQSYEIYNSENKLIEKRLLEINFKPIKDKELKEMLINTNLKITHIYGDYTYSQFNEEKSNFMIYKLTTK